MKISKFKQISSALSENIDDLLKRLYLDEKMSSIEISEYFESKVNVLVTPRAIQMKIKRIGITRSPSDRFVLAIRKKRMDYTPRKKKITSKELRKGISLKLRYEIFKRDDFKCVLCGATAKDDELVVDHVKPVVQGGTNTQENLRVLCRACNHGKMIYEQEK